MKNALVTGAEGFIGSHLAEQLLKNGYHVRALTFCDNPATSELLEKLSPNTRLEIIKGDVKDADLCDVVTRGIDVVFHLAALAGVPYSFVNPDIYINTNVVGTLNICKAARKNHVSRFVHTSTSDVYGTAKYIPIDENHPIQAQSPYSASKIGADAIASSFYNSFNMPVTIARPFNTYGPGQSLTAVIPSIIVQIAKGHRKIKIGDVNTTRDFNYVKDTCNGFIALAEFNETIGEVVNLGSNKEILIMDLLCLIKELMHSNVEYLIEKTRLRPAGSEILRVRCDNSKMVALTGFTPQFSLTEGLQLTIDWFSNKDRLDKIEINKEQIQL